MANPPELSESIAVIGGGTLRTGFRLAGLSHLYPASTPAEGEALLARLMADPAIGIIIVEERLLESADWRLKKKIRSSLKFMIL